MCHYPMLLVEKNVCKLIEVPFDCCPVLTAKSPLNSSELFAPLCVIFDAAPPARQCTDSPNSENVLHRRHYVVRVLETTPEFTQTKA